MLRSPALPDLIRLLAVPILGWAAWRDFQTQRVPNKTWIPIAGLAFLAFVLDLTQITFGMSVYRDPAHFFIATIFSASVLIPFSYLAWYSKRLGGADAKALMLIAVLYPAVPHYATPQPLVELGLPTVLPFIFTEHGIFSFTILLNIVIVGTLSPVALGVWNLFRGHLSPLMFIARPVSLKDVTNIHGIIAETHFREAPSKRIDNAVLSAYLDWRDTTLSDLLTNPDDYRNFEIGEHPTSVATGDKQPDGGDAPAGDPWGAVSFLQEDWIPADRVTPSQLRESLDYLADHPNETIWMSPNIPYVIPIFLGTLLAVTAGNLLLIFTVYVL